MSNKESGIVPFHGKAYKTVALRVSELRAEHPDWAIKTKLMTNAELIVMKATVIDEAGKVIGQGHAEEVRGSSQINKTSALENCETSAIGRALAACGLAGTEYASADEVANAIGQQNEMDNPLVEYNAFVRDNISTFYFIKEALSTSDYGLAKESWDELSDDEKKLAWKAPSKGGIFTTEERKQMREPEFRTANGENNNGE